MSEESRSPHLDSLLSRLRPFQRAAFEFAVHSDAGDGPPSGGGGGSKTTKRKKPGRKNPVGRGGGEKAVAGAGTGRILLGDEMGLGKTLTSLAIMMAYQQTEWPLLILCPASLRYTWPAEIEKFCPWIPSQSIHVVRGKDDVHFAVKIHKWRNRNYQNTQTNKMMERGQGPSNENQSKCPVQIVIVTYSLLQTRYQIANTLRDCEFECIIADESHNLKQLSSQRCQLALPLLHRSRRLVLLSGTPALNRPVELWPQLHALDAKGRIFGEGGMSYTAYTKQYCNARRTRFGWDVKGVSNAGELHECLKSVMMRRLKSDVLCDLPSKQRSIVPVTISDKERERESRDTMMQLGMARQAVSEITDLDADEVANSAQWEARKLLMQAYQASGVAKAPATTEFILDWLDGSDATQKLVVFAHHKDVLDYIEATVSKKHKGRLGMMRIDGSVPPAERALRVKKFQSNKSIRLALLSMTAAGVGLTLTAASNVIFAELHWTPGVLAQAEDRCHRIGQPNSVNVMYCICKDEEVSVDMQLWKLLGRKVGNLSRVVDGERVRLNAVEKEASESSRGGKNVSVEEELSSFFASQGSSVSSKPCKGPVVRGSIQSFFKKQAKRNEASKASPSEKEKLLKVGDEVTITSKDPKVRATTPAYISLLDEEPDVIEPKAKHKEKAQKMIISLLPEETKPASADVDAQTCALSNTDHEFRPQTDIVEEEQGSLSTQEWQCCACTYMNKIEMLSCEMCEKERQTERGERKETLPEGSDQAGTDGNGHNCSMDSAICEESEFVDDNWSDEDFDAIDLMTQSHSKVSQSPNSSAHPISPNVLQQECATRDTASKGMSCLANRADLLFFSVSRNSGRIAIHHGSSGQPLHVNFEIAQVLTKQSADLFEELNLQRTVSKSSSNHQQRITFDDGSVRQILAAIDEVVLPTTMSSEETQQAMCNELKRFVRCYLSLREVEKKALKESGEAIAPSFLRQTVARLLVSTVTGTTERYLGGAKERALANVKNGCATATDKAVIAGKACAWCAKQFLCSDGATYCSQTCAEEGRLRRGGMYSSTRIREQLFALERGICQKCGIDAHSLFCRIKALHPAERLNTLLNAKWKLPRGRKAVDRLMNDPKESDFWQADHKVAVAEGGGSTGLDNLRTLCVPCHIGETEKLFARLKTLPSVQSDELAKDGFTQTDIMSCFSKMQGAESARMKNGETEKLYARPKTLPSVQSDELAKDGLTQTDIMSCFSKMKGAESARMKKRMKRKRAAD